MLKETFMSDNSNSSVKGEAAVEDVKYRGAKLIFIIIIILNGVVILLLNAFSARFIIPNIEFTSDAKLAFIVISCSSFLIILFFAHNIVLLKKKIRKIPLFIADLSLMILSISILVLFAEICMRAFFPHLGVNLYGYNKKLQMNFMMPNLDVQIVTPEYNVNYRTNSFGLRGERELLPKMPNEERIMVLGDSFIHAAQVAYESTMCFKLEELLSEQRSTPASAKSFSVINAAMSGWTPTNERIFIEKNLQLLEPDIIVLCLYVGNDFGETINQHRKENRPLSEKQDAIHVRVLRVFKLIAMNHSKLFTFFYQRVTKTKWPMGRANQPFHNQGVNVFNVNYNQEIKDAFHIVESELIKTRDTCREHNIKFILMIIPTKEQVDSLKLQETVDFMKIDTKQIELAKPQNLLIKFADQNNISTLCLLDTLKEAGKTNPVYFDIDSHWNVIGNSVVAEAVFNYLYMNGISSRGKEDEQIIVN